MSNSEGTEDTLLQSVEKPLKQDMAFQKPAEFICSTLMLLATWTAIDILFMSGIPIWPSLKFMSTALLVFLTTRSNVVFLLAMLILSWGFRETPRSQFNPAIDSVVSTFFALCFLAWASCYQEIRRIAVELALRILQLNTHEPSVGSVLTMVRPRLLLGRMVFFVKLLIFVLAAVFLLNHQPWTFESESWFRWTMQNKQVLWPGPTLIVILIGTLVFLGEFSWRLRSRSQKRIYLRSEGAKTLYPDLRRIK